MVFDCAALQVDQWPIRTDHRSRFSTRDTEDHGDKDKDWAQSGRMFIEEKRENN